MPGVVLGSRDIWMGKMLSSQKEFVIRYIWGCGKEATTDASTLKPKLGLSLLASSELSLSADKLS